MPDSSSASTMANVNKFYEPLRLNLKGALKIKENTGQLLRQINDLKSNYI